MPINNWIIPATQIDIWSSQEYSSNYVNINLNLDSLYRVNSPDHSLADRSFYFDNGCTLSLVTNSDSSSLKNFSQIWLGGADEASVNTDNSIIFFEPLGNYPEHFTSFPISINLSGKLKKSTTCRIKCSMNVQITFEGTWTE